MHSRGAFTKSGFRVRFPFAEQFPHCVFIESILISGLLETHSVCLSSSLRRLSNTVRALILYHLLRRFFTSSDERSFVVTSNFPRRSFT